MRLAAAAVVVLGLLAGCSRTTEGAVAQTTEPGPPLTTPSQPSPTSTLLPGIPIPDIEIPLPTRDTDVPIVPAPANALEMPCSEYSDLDDATQRAVIRAIVADDSNPWPPGEAGEAIAKTMADAMCQFLPNATVNEIVLGGSPP